MKFNAKLFFDIIVMMIMIQVFACNAEPSKQSRSRKYTCGECIAASPANSWCSDPSTTEQRCDVTENIITSCNIGFIHKFNSTVEQLNTSDGYHEESANENPIKMNPRFVKLKMRPNESMSFPLTFIMSKNYPIDIYFLFDASHTMVNYTDKVATIIDELVKEIKNLTSSFKIGFGSFVDKETLPFIPIFDNEHRAFADCNSCQPGYSFINRMNLSSDLPLIKATLRSINPSANLDLPEGGFDAIVQSVVCKDIIGWRHYSRKMIILFTDEQSHTAGDGKLGGIVEPNSLQCHLDEFGKYTWSHKEDYPSVAELASVIEENRVNLIFAVTQNIANWYDQVCNVIPGCAVGLLSEDPHLVTKIVSDNYFKIQSSIQLSVNATNNIQVSIRSNCNGDVTNVTSACFGVKVGEEVTFEMTVSSTTCGRTAFNVIPVGVQENLKVEVEAVCSCGCHGDVSNSSHCQRRGDLKCGLCNCNPGYHGDKCQCSGDVSLSDVESCKSSNNSEICSGRGYCKCGECQCLPLNEADLSKKYSGKFCQCDDYSCLYVDNKMCSGNGLCKCGRCQCYLGYSGSDCSCKTDTTNCLSSNNKICNDKGTCECGSCNCNIDNRYKGVTCDDCPTCPGMCHQMVECATCYLSAKDTDTCSDYCGAKLVNKVPVITASKLTPGENLCRILGEDTCYVIFYFNYKEATITVQSKKECIKIDYGLIIGSAVGGVVVAGLMLLLAWKVVVTIYDKREYQAFEAEKKNAKWNECINPLYQRAIIKYDNPTFKARSPKS